MKRNNNTSITYVDGTKQDVCVTMHMRGRAEAYAKAHGWGGGTESPIRQFQYAAYCALRRDGGTTLPFEQWQDDVADIETITSSEDANESENPQTSSTSGSQEE